MISELLKKMRKHRGWTQEDAAKEFGVTVRALASWEAGASPANEISVRKHIEQLMQCK